MLAFVASFVIGLDSADKQRAAPARATVPEPLAIPDSRVRVQVLNGSDEPGLARLVTDQLREAGYDVVNFGNARISTKTSTVVDRVGKPEIALRVAQALTINRIETRVDTALYLEVTVILGHDFTDKNRPKTPTQ